MSAASPAPPGPARSSTRTGLVRAAQIALGAALVTYLLGSGQLDLTALATVLDRWPWWLAANGTMAGVILATTLRWHLLLCVHPIAIRLRDTASLVLMGWCLNQVSPGATGGDIAKGLTLASEHRAQWPAAVLSIVLDRVLGVATLITMVACAAVVFHSTLRASPLLEVLASFAILGVLGMAAGVAVLLWFPERWRPREATLRRIPGWDRSLRIREALATYRRFPGSVLRASVCGLLLHVCNVLTAVLLACALFGPDVPLRAVSAVVPMILLAAGVPITPFGNAGVFEATYAELLLQVGVSGGALLGLLHRSVSWTWALVGAGVFAFRRFGARPEAPPRGEGVSL